MRRKYQSMNALILSAALLIAVSGCGCKDDGSGPIMPDDPRERVALQVPAETMRWQGEMCGEVTRDSVILQARLNKSGAWQAEESAVKTERLAGAAGLDDPAKMYCRSGVSGAGVTALLRAAWRHIEAARAAGAGDRRIVFRHILPNAMSPIIVQTTLIIGAAIIIEAALSFLGFGVRPPTPTWGAMVAQGGRMAVRGFWWEMVFSGFALVSTVLAINFLGDGLRDALDPTQTIERK